MINYNTYHIEELIWEKIVSKMIIVKVVSLNIDDMKKVTVYYR